MSVPHPLRRDSGEAPPPFSSVATGPDRSLYAASLGRGVYRITSGGEWGLMSEQWPEGAAVNRLQMCSDGLAACTSQGLFVYRSCWEPTDIAIPVYRLREGGGRTAVAATHYGVWGLTGDGWLSWAYPDCIIYDVLYLPQYLFAGREGAISMYDRLTGGWVDFPVRAAVTSLALFRGMLVGAGDRGQLIVANGSGRFDSYRFPGLFVTGLVQRRGDVYACTDRGLFRLEWLRRALTLLPVRLGSPVADAAFMDDKIVMATLSSGIQSV